MIVNNEEIAKAVDRVSTMALERLRPIKLSIDKGQCNFDFLQSETGEAREELEIQYDAEPIEIDSMRSICLI